jgi:hypothetical protein
VKPNSASPRELDPGPLRPVRILQVPRAAAILRFAFPWRSSTVGWAFAWLALILRPHWTDSGGTVLIGLRPVPARLRNRMRRNGIALPMPAFLVSHFASRRRGQHVHDVAAFVQRGLMVVDQAGICLIAKARPGNHRLVRMYRRIGFYDLVMGQTSHEFIWLRRDPVRPAP